MHKISSEDFIQCSFKSDKSSQINLPLTKVEVYYGISRDLYAQCLDLRQFLTSEENLKAGRLRFIEDRNTYILSHSLLRLIISGKLGKNPMDINFYNEKNNKPEIIGKPIYFNITHTRNAFAFVLSEQFYVGVDMEDIDKRIDFMAIIDNYFSERECRYIKESEPDTQNRFFRLWTRKEALLKAFGTGIVSDLKVIELLNDENVIDRKTFEDLLCYPLFDVHFIYSVGILNYFLSIAIPNKSEILLKRIDQATAFSFSKRI